MTDAIRDANHVPVALGVSSADSTVTLPMKINQATGGLIIDLTGGSAPVADGTYTVGNRITPVTGNLGTITVQDGIITAIQEAT